jgi:predicted CoA-binding protein
MRPGSETPAGDVGSPPRARTPAEILGEARTIALVGASRREWRPSHSVLRYLLAAGYDVVPVNPTCAGEEILGRRVVASLREIEGPIDVVDVFRRPEHTPEVAREAVEVGAGALWLQLGIRSPEAARIALAGGLAYVEDLCTAVVHRRSARE